MAFQCIHYVIIINTSYIKKEHFLIFFQIAIVSEIFVPQILPWWWKPESFPYWTAIAEGMLFPIILLLFDKQFSVRIAAIYSRQTVKRKLRDTPPGMWLLSTLDPSLRRKVQNSYLNSQFFSSSFLLTLRSNWHKMGRSKPQMSYLWHITWPLLYIPTQPKIPLLTISCSSAVSGNTNMSCRVLW